MKEIQTFQAPTKEIVEALGDVTLDLKNPKQTRRDVETFQTGFQAGLISQLGSKLDPIS